MTRKEEKQLLRKAIRAAERELPQAYKDRSSAEICAHLIAMPEYQAADAVFAFVGTSREIDTTAFLEDALRRGKQLCVPLCVGDGLMELHHITSLMELQTGSYGIREPSADTPIVPVDAIDFAVIPCLSCSHAGKRLGQGGGFYDRFLSKYRSAAVLVCREQLTREELPVEPHDMPIPWVVTERGLYEDGFPARIE